jgi:hypothetical protein
LLGTPGTQASALTAMGALLNSTTAKTTTYGVVAGDRGKLIDCTSGTFSLTLLAATTAGDGFAFAVRNSGTGTITIDPNSSELIDGATTITLAAGESCLCVCNGSAWKTVGRTSATAIDVQTFNSNNNWIKPVKGTVALVEVWGAGGSGCRSGGGGRAAGGGGGGGYAAKVFFLANLASTVTVTVGAGGAARSSGTALGQNGGNTTFGSLRGLGGGGGLYGGLDSPTGSAGGGAGDFDGQGGEGGGGGTFELGVTGGASHFGGGGGGHIGTNTAGAGGTSTFAGSGGSAAAAGTAGSGITPSGGGGATLTGVSGAGGNGHCIVTVF